MRHVGIGSSILQAVKECELTIFRTPEANFHNLKDWPYDVTYFESRLYGLEIGIAYYDLGDEEADETVVLTHGMSGWSYLNRRMAPPLIEAGYRVILFDQVGCGRSDKPVNEQDYSYERHIGWNLSLIHI